MTGDISVIFYICVACDRRHVCLMLAVTVVLQAVAGATGGGAGGGGGAGNVRMARTARPPASLPLVAVKVEGCVGCEVG